MDQVPALPGIISKVLVILDKALGAFATVTEKPISESCGITRYYVNVSDTGESLVNNLTQLIYGLISYLSEYLASLTAVAT